MLFSCVFVHFFFSPSNLDQILNVELKIVHAIKYFSTCAIIHIFRDKIGFVIASKKKERLRDSTICVQTCANSAHSKNVVPLKMMAVKYDILKCRARE